MGRSPEGEQPKPQPEFQPEGGGINRPRRRPPRSTGSGMGDRPLGRPKVEPFSEPLDRASVERLAGLGYSVIDINPRNTPELAEQGIDKELTIALKAVGVEYTAAEWERILSEVKTFTISQMVSQRELKDEPRQSKMGRGHPQPKE